MIQKKIFLGLLAAVILMAAASCNMNQPSDEEQRKIRIVYPDWSEGIALAHLSHYLLEEKLSYDAEMKLTDVESAYRELAEGKSDIFPDAWLPETQKVYYSQYKDKLNQLGIIYPEARTGFVVPDYSEMRTIEDLANYKYPIIGIDPGAGVMIKSRKAIDAYGFSNELKSLSENEMIKYLEDSVKRRSDVVITGWEPHWIFARYQVRFLEDPEEVFGRKEKIFAISRKGLEEEHPHAVRFFERMQLSEKQLNSLVYEVQMNEDPKLGVKEWIRQNEYVVNIWTKDLMPQRKKIY